MCIICRFVAWSLYFQIIDNPDTYKLICLMKLVNPRKHQSFRPSKFELSYKITFLDPSLTKQKPWQTSLTL